MSTRDLTKSELKVNRPHPPKDLVSICCGSRPLDGYVDSDIQDGKIVWLGRCADCKDGSEFVTIKELEKM